MNKAIMHYYLILKTLKEQHQYSAKGQGVIEYAGALVIAAVLVAAVISIGPDGIGQLFGTIMTRVESFFTGALPGGGEGGGEGG